MPESKLLSAVQINIELNFAAFSDDGHLQRASLLQELVDVLGRRDGDAVDVGDDVAGSQAGPVGGRVLNHPEDQDSLVDVEWKMVSKLELLNDAWVQRDHGYAKIPGKGDTNWHHPHSMFRHFFTPFSHTYPTYIRVRLTDGDARIFR